MSTPSIPVRALDLLASEWTKFRSVRSTYWSLLVAVVTPVAVSAVVAFAFTSARNQGPPPDPLLPGVISLEYALIAVSVALAPADNFVAAPPEPVSGPSAGGWRRS